MNGNIIYCSASIQLTCFLIRNKKKNAFFCLSHNLKNIDKSLKNKLKTCQVHFSPIILLIQCDKFSHCLANYVNILLALYKMYHL